MYLEKLICFYIKNNYYSYSFAMRLVIAPVNFLGKHVRIDAFSVYFDCILNEKNGSFHIEIIISATHMLPCEKILKRCAIWCVLVNILIS